MKFLRMKPGHGEVLLTEGDPAVREEEERLVEAFRFAMGRPEVLRRLAEMDTIAQYLPPAEFREDVADYMRFWSGLVDRMGLRVEG